MVNPLDTQEIFLKMSKVVSPLFFEHGGLFSAVTVSGLLSKAKQVCKIASPKFL